MTPTSGLTNSLPFDFDSAAKAVNDHFVSGTGPLFTTTIDPDMLWHLYLSHMPEGFARQHHNCSCCRQFIKKFGGLVRVQPNGTLVSAFWPELPEGHFYADSFLRMAQAVALGKLTGPFLTKEPLVWGQPTTGKWSHFSVIAQPDAVWRSPVVTPGQRMAVKRQDFITVSRALSEFKKESLETALQIVKGEHLDRSERFVGPLQWLLDLQPSLRNSGRGKNINLRWLAISTAPDGYLHPRSGVLGQLLGWIDEGQDFPTIQRRWKSLVNPLQYQRPTVAPARANIEAAEKAFAALGLAPALERRFATLADLEETLWTPPTATTKAPAGIFGNIPAKGESRQHSESLTLPAKPTSWERFSVLLPQMISIELLVPSHGQFMAFTTAAIAESPQLLKWPNPVAWYVYPNGSPASRWGLTGGLWTKVTAVAALPTMWGKAQPHLGEGALLALEGCEDSRTQGSFLDRYAAKTPGNAIFPEAVRGDLHPYRDVIEAYSHQATLARPDGPLASGYDLRRGHEGKPQLRCRMAGMLPQTYVIDRWE